MRNQVLEFNSGAIDEIGIFGDRFRLFQANYTKSRAKMEQIESLMVDWGLKRTNQKSKTKIKKVRKAKVDIEFLTGFNCTKS